MVESTFDFSERLFSLDSDDTSYIQHADYFNGLKTQPFLLSESISPGFENCSVSNISDTDNDSDDLNSTKLNQQEQKFIFENLIEQLEDIGKPQSLTDIDNFIKNMPNSEPNSISNYSDNQAELDLENISLESDFIPWHPDENINNSNNLINASNFLSEEEISLLIDGEVKLPSNSLREVQEHINEDTIACFNVRNKYEHTAAAELFIRENLSYLAIQEPFCSKHKVSDSWKAYRQLELQSARIRCFETPYQVILFDTWKWGGKLLYPFQSKQHGRVTSIAFKFGDQQQIGFISVYAPADVLNSSQSNEGNSSLQITTDIVMKIKDKWESENPNIQVIILGDLQETISIYDKDNIGKYRQKQVKNGILNSTTNSHDSIVRKLHDKKEYITRFGSEGGRGIDHILIPKNSVMSNWILGAKVDREKGAEFFPSDHSLISCTFRRFGMNNNEGGTMKTKYDYKKVCSIKLKQTGEFGEVLNLDETQFKDCQSFKDQKLLFHKIRELTGNNSNFTNNQLKDLEIRIDALYSSIWTEGIKQKVDGKNNKLIDISEDHAVELAYILQQFNQGVKEAMQSWNLTCDHNANDSAGKIRGRVRKKKGFKLFANLPASTKLYYLKKKIMAKTKLVQQKLYWLDEFKIRKKNNADIIDKSSLWKNSQDITDSSNIIESAEVIHGLIISEQEERTNHIEAMEFKQLEMKLSQRKLKSKKLKKPAHACNPNHSGCGNMLQASEDTIKKINFWLGRSKCKQSFNKFQTKDTFGMLIGNKLAEWSIDLNEIMNLDLNIDLEDDFDRIQLSLQKAKSNLHRIYASLTSMQSTYKKNLLNYFLKSNKISDFTRKVLPKSRSAPSTHSVIWDALKGDFRACIDEVEEMVATSEYHGKWMGNSSADEICAYAKLVNKGRLGCRGIKLSPNRVISKKNLGTLLPNHKKLSKKVKQAFLKAHGPHTAKLFREPSEDRKELFYPFFLTSIKGDMNEDSRFIRNFWKGLVRIPGKARYEGFQMSVIGRFGGRWGNLLLNLTKLMLVMRYIPPELRKMARFPIPKPGKTNEYRPISLCNDLYCYINSISTSYSSIGIEQSNLLHDGMNAYRKGRGCSSLVTTELSFREDCSEHNIPTLQLDEDEEKFFDRVPVEILLAAMRTNGFPCQGFLELKASSMQSKTVEIITAKGVAYAKFVCGLEQGNPDSPTISNLVIKMKHDIWKHVTSEAAKILKRSNNSSGKYVFNSVDQNDGPVQLCRIGYCDDNSKFCCAKDENDLKFLAKYFLQLSGDLSMVTKIGRKSSKCELQFYNVSSNFVLNIDNFRSTAWSYISDGPIEEEVPYKINMKAKERRDLYDSINYFNLNEDEQATWDMIIHPKAHRHLGLKCTLSGNTNSNCQDTLRKIDERLKRLNIANMETEVQRKCINMLCSTMHSFVPLQTGFQAADLTNSDNIISESLLRRNGLTNSDCRHRLFLPENIGGLGFISLLDQDIISVSREFEIISNLSSLDGRSFRTRIEATKNYQGIEKEDIINHAKASIDKLARYGIFVRDRHDDLVNNILGRLNETNKFPSLGTSIYKDGNKASIGNGKTKNEQLAFGGPIHEILIRWQKDDWKLNDLMQTALHKYKIKMPNLINIKNEAIEDRFMSIAGIFSYWEWKNNFNFSIRQIPKHANQWTFIDIPSILKRKFPHTYNLWNEGRIRMEASKLIQMKGWNSCMNKSSQLFNTYEYTQHLIKHLFDANIPILISTDGAHSNSFPKDNTKTTSTTSAFVISTCDIREGESIQSGQWKNRPSIPLLSRATELPQMIGNSDSDIATGELYAIALSELTLPTDLPRILITDSKSTRDVLLELRNADQLGTDRFYIRKIAGGISKFIFNLFQNRFLNIVSENHHHIPDAIRKSFEESMQNMNSIAKTWTIPKLNQSNDVNTKNTWTKDYWDDHKLRSIWKIDSHQLSDDGTKINKTPRYPELLPNLGILSTNHHADVCADYIGKFEQKTRNIKIAFSALRFFLTWDGKTVDRHVSSFIKSKIDCERVKRLKLKPTQGLIWRMEGYTKDIWSIFQSHAGIFRSMLGFSRSHTRCLYKNEGYRDLCKNIMTHQQIMNPEHLDILKNSSNSQAIIDILSPCMWCDKNNNFLPSDKGNRKHMFLHCNNNHIKDFRDDTNALLNQNLMKFFSTMTTTTSWNFVENVLINISEEFLKHQSNHAGRLKKIPKNRNHSYLSISELCKKWNQSKLEKLIQDERCDILLEIIGMLPAHDTLEKGDEELGVMDLPWLGLIPIFLDDIIENACKESNIFHPGDIHLNPGVAQLRSMWIEIKAIVLGRAIGLHRVTGTTGKEIEKSFKRITSGDSEEEINQENIVQPKIATSPASNSKRTISSISVTESPPKKKIRNTTTDLTAVDISAKVSSLIDTIAPQTPSRAEDPELKPCNGITCGNENIFWCQDCTFVRVKIKQNVKQCQRCGRFMTAMKQAHSVTLSLLREKNNNDCEKVVAFCKQHIDNLQHQYISFMNLLDSHLGETVHLKEAKSTNKKHKRTPERHKLICKVLHRCVLHFAKKYDSEEIIIQSTAKLISTTILQINQKHTSCKDAIKIPTIPNPLFGAYSFISHNKDTAKTILTSTHAISANSPNIYLAGAAISQAVEVIRARLTWNVFVAHADAYLSINSWSPNQSWSTFARIFSSQRVLDEKLNGTYIIPYFSGREASGHWHLIIIEKRRHFCEGWHVDSLGKSLENTIIIIINYILHGILRYHIGGKVKAMGPCEHKLHKLKKIFCIS